MKEAYRKMIHKYAPILLALLHYIHTGWSIEILPWVVGIRGFADTKHINTALEYLTMPKSQWEAMIEDSVLASVRALVYMHKIRYSGAGRQSAMDISDLPAICTKNIRKRRQLR
jgi:hypothetical protein